MKEVVNKTVSNFIITNADWAELLLPMVKKNQKIQGFIVMDPKGDEFVKKYSEKTAIKLLACTSAEEAINKLDKIEDDIVRNELGLEPEE